MINMELPRDLEEQLKETFGQDLGQAAKESLLIEAYRRGRLSVGRLAEFLGVSIDRAYRFLKDHEITVNYSLEDFDADCASLRELRTQGS